MHFTYSVEVLTVHPTFVFICRNRIGVDLLFSRLQYLPVNR